MAGFFSSEQLQETAVADIVADGTECLSCGLSYRTQGMSEFPCVGKGEKGIMIVLDCALSIESRRKKQFVSGAPRELEQRLRRYGIDMLRDCWVTRALRCPVRYEKGMPTATTVQINSCRARLQVDIKSHKPKVIVAMGDFAIQSVIGKHVAKASVLTCRGLQIPDQTLGAWVLSTFSLEYLETRANDENLHTTVKRDLQKIFRFALSAPKLPNTSAMSKQIECVTSFKHIKELLTTVNNTPPANFYFDYETTGLKPHVAGHKILYASFCTDNIAYSFPLQHKDFFSKREQRILCGLFSDILVNPHCDKTAHNCKFEEIWTSNILKQYVSHWGLDTLLAAHIWDNRRGFTSLKFQTYAVFGIAPYDNAVKRYLTAGTGNGFNTLEQLNPSIALRYNALDSRYGFELHKHYDHLYRLPENKRYREAYTLFHNGTITFADVQENGLCMNEEHYETQKIVLRKEIVKINKKIMSSVEAKEYLAKYGKPINVDSPKELSTLLYTMLSYPLKTTDNGTPSVDKQALEEINSEFTNDILAVRQRQKIVNTFIAQFQNEVVNGKIHASFDLNIPITYRSSSSAPNLQNISVRNELAKNVCRGGLVPSKGNKILEADYSGVEVRVSATVHKDPNMINYILDDTTDMHRDTAADLWMLAQSAVTKQIRQSAKGNWVFPQFYGSWYKECAENLWKECIGGGFVLGNGVLLKDHMKEKGITTLGQFTKHCKKMEEIFWGTRFKGYAQWKKDINKEFRQNGFITNHFGFTFTGYMSEKDASNYPVQSAAFHCLLWAKNRIHRYIEEHELQTKIIGQVHDSLIFDLCPAEEVEIIAVVNYLGTTALRNTFDWIIVPLDIEYEATAIDAPWSTKKEVPYTERHRQFEQANLLGEENKPYIQDAIIWEEQ